MSLEHGDMPIYIFLSRILLPFLVSILYFCDFATFSCFNIIFLWFCYLFLFQYYISVILLPFLVSILYFCDVATFSCFNIIFLWFCYLFLFQYYISVILLPFLVSILYFCDVATFSCFNIIFFLCKMFDMIWFWLNLWLNPLRWVFQLSDAHHARGIFRLSRDLTLDRLTSNSVYQTLKSLQRGEGWGIAQARGSVLLRRHQGERQLERPPVELEPRSGLCSECFSECYTGDDCAIHSASGDPMGDTTVAFRWIFFACEEVLQEVAWLSAKARR